MTEHYFSATPQGSYVPREIAVTLGGTEYALHTAGGVFSPEHLDQGTQLLLRVLDAAPQEPATGANDPILDLGCGWGPIALSAALRTPNTQVWAVDVNERARELTSANAAKMGLTSVHVAAPDDVPTDVQFSEIHSNPPIRVGKVVLHDMLRSWLPRLIPGGTATLVVAKHLGADSLQKWIAAEFSDFSVERTARDKGFHIITAVRD